MIIPVNTDSAAGTPLISLLDLAARTEALDQQVIGVRPGIVAYPYPQQVNHTFYLHFGKAFAGLRRISPFGQAQGWNLRSQRFTQYWIYLACHTDWIPDRSVAPSGMTEEAGVFRLPTASPRHRVPVSGGFSSFPPANPAPLASEASGRETALIVFIATVP